MLFSEILLGTLQMQVGAELRLRQLEDQCMEAKTQLQRGMRDLN